MLVLAVVCIAAGVIGLARRAKARTLNVMLSSRASSSSCGASWPAPRRPAGPPANELTYNWAIQTVAVVLAGVCVWCWAAGNPERRS